ncbi:hypothetical protein C0389_07950 [bacterium]|nr:hypothetical protein [bacterium]
MKRLFKILSTSLLVFVASCTQYSEIPFPDQDSIPIRDEPVTIHLNYKQEVTIDGKFNLRFEGVGADSRCPIDVICIWAGDGEVLLRITTGNSSQRYTVHTTLEPREIVIDNYLIQLINLFPSTRSDRRIKPEEYNVDIRVTKLIRKSPYSVQLIDAGNTGMIRKDMLNVSEISLANDLLDFTVEYSGGCREHLIELFALKEIEKSNPARVTINMSHMANGDMCLAYITRKVQFDLNPLKQFLKSHYGINDRVILVMFDPSGRPLKNPTIEYKF